MLPIHLFFRPILNFRLIDRSDDESRDGQSASDRAIVKSDVRRTGTDRSPGDPLRPVLDLNPTLP